MPLPANLTPREVMDLGIHFEYLMLRTYDRLGHRTDFASLKVRLADLKKDERDHKKTLKAHRRSMFGNAEPAATEDEARRIFPVVDVREARDVKSLVSVLRKLIAAEQYGAHFYDRLKDCIPDREARIFLEVLVSEGHFHEGILRGQITTLQRVVAAIRT